MAKAAKGSVWEREFSRLLSLWWSAGESEEHFWRTPGSGARSTVRGKTGRTTANSYGDIMAQTAEGQKLLNLCTFELKKGYQSVTMQDLLDKPGKRQIEDFLNQAKSAASLAGTPFWMLVHKRDRRDAIVYTNYLPAPVYQSYWFSATADGLFFVLKLDDFLCDEVRQDLKSRDISC